MAGDLGALCAALKAKGAEFSVGPYDFLPGRTIAYLKAPDGVTVELTEAAATIADGRSGTGSTVAARRCWRNRPRQGCQRRR